MKAILIAMVALSANANASQFCGFAAKGAVQALASVNATVSDTITVLNSPDGKTFQVQASEAGLGQDLYEVRTTGGHDCIVMSVKVKSGPTSRP